MQIILDKLQRTEVVDLLREHLEDMLATSPRESVHALDIDGLRSPLVTFWTVWDGGTLLGCGALKHLNSGDGEIKSMRTATAHRRRGVAATMLAHIVAEATRRRYGYLHLETGSAPPFAAARALYERYGFTYRGPFDTYVDDPHSVFMTKRIR